MSTLRVDTILGESGAERRGLMTYAIICDEKDHNVDGGTFTAGAWRTRTLNTKIADPDNIVSISASNDQFTLNAGSYLIEASAPFYQVGRSQLRLYNATDTSVVQYGANAYCGNTGGVHGNALLFVRVTITASTVFEIQHRGQVDKATIGFGLDNNFGETSIYTVVKIFKEA